MQADLPLTPPPSLLASGAVAFKITRMKTIGALSLVFIGAALALVSFAVQAASSPPPAKPSRQQLCRQYANAQLKATNAGTTSGTTVTSFYDAASGFCTVEISNTTPGHAFSGKMVTNTFDASPTTIRIQSFAEPIRFHSIELPQQLICSKVTTLKDGRKACTPYTPDETSPLTGFFLPAWF